MTPCNSLCSLEMFRIFLHVIFNRKNTRQLRGFLKIIPHFTAYSRYGTDVCNQCRKPSPLCIYEKWRRDNFRSVNVWTCCSLQTRTVLISNNSKVPQIPSINTAHTFILIKVSFELYYSFWHTVDIPYVHQKRLYLSDRTAYIKDVSQALF